MSWRTPGDPYFPRANPNTRDEISALRAEVRERKEENAELRARVTEFKDAWGEREKDVVQISEQFKAARAELEAEIATLRTRVAELARDWAVADEHDKVSRKLLTHAEAQVAELSARLKETAALVQALARFNYLCERDEIRIFDEEGNSSLRTIGGILDDANKALEPKETGNGD